MTGLTEVSRTPTTSHRQLPPHKRGATIRKTHSAYTDLKSWPRGVTAKACDTPNATREMGMDKRAGTGVGEERLS
jgi:hypothetical protein